MFYTDNVTFSPPFSGTGTASATDGIAVTAQLFKTIKSYSVGRINITVLVAPAANTTGLSFVVKAGTNTLGAAAIGTNSTAGSAFELTMVGSNAQVPESTAITAVVTGTGTASGQNIGTYVAQWQ